ncbi:hypothetical protein Hanom_Chr15g01390151 [Helianthus anomalus]
MSRLCLTQSLEFCLGGIANVNWVILLTRVHCLILIDYNQEVTKKGVVLSKTTMRVHLIFIIYFHKTSIVLKHN